MKKDIRNRKDIEKLINAFYDKVKSDDVIGYLFNEVAKVNWEEHVATMYDFWENILFYKGNYNGSPIPVHKELHEKSPMNATHFNHWNKLFKESVDQLFTGIKAEEIKNRAVNISAVLMSKILT